jgi:hypothetical protein
MAYGMRLPLKIAGSRSAIQQLLANTHQVRHLELKLHH